MSEYKKGQEDLIKHIKEEVSKLEDNADFIIDVYLILKNLKPIESR